MNECFLNVEGYVQKHGGASTLGWAIWQRANVLIEAEAHAVWKSPTGELIDVTPHSYDEKQILFLPDITLNYSGKCIPSFRLPLTASPLVAEFIELFNKRDKLMTEALGNFFSMPAEMLFRMQEIEYIISSKAARNDFCPCGSGLKYQKCCGLFE